MILIFLASSLLACQLNQELKVAGVGVSEVGHIALSPKEDVLIEFRQDGTFRLWDVAQRKVLQVIQSSFKKTKKIAFSRNGGFFAVTGYPERTVIYSRERHHILYEKRYDFKFVSRDIAFDTDRGLLYTQQKESIQVNVWDAYLGSHLRNIPTGGLANFALSPEGRHLAYASTKNELLILDIETGELQRTAELPKRTGFVKDIEFTDNGRTIGLTTNLRLYLFNLDSQKLSRFKNNGRLVERFQFLKNDHLAVWERESRGTKSLSIYEVKSINNIPRKEILATTTTLEPNSFTQVVSKTGSFFAQSGHGQVFLTGIKKNDIGLAKGVSAPLARLSVRSIALYSSKIIFCLLDYGSYEWDFIGNNLRKIADSNLSISEVWASKHGDCFGWSEANSTWQKLVDNSTPASRKDKAIFPGYSLLELDQENSVLALKSKKNNDDFVYIDTYTLESLAPCNNAYCSIYPHSTRQCPLWSKNDGRRPRMHDWLLDANSPANSVLLYSNDLQAVSFQKGIRRFQIMLGKKGEEQPINTWTLNTDNMWMKFSSKGGYFIFHDGTTKNINVININNGKKMLFRSWASERISTTKLLNGVLLLGTETGRIHVVDIIHEVVQGELFLYSPSEWIMSSSTGNLTFSPGFKDLVTSSGASSSSILTSESRQKDDTRLSLYSVSTISGLGNQIENRLQGYRNNNLSANKRKGPVRRTSGAKSNLKRNYSPRLSAPYSYYHATSSEITIPIKYSGPPLKDLILYLDNEKISSYNYASDGTIDARISLTKESSTFTAFAVGADASVSNRISVEITTTKVKPRKDIKLGSYTRKYAVVIGISDYLDIKKHPETNFGLKNLRYGAKDAAAFVQILKDSSTFGKDWHIQDFIGENALEEDIDTALTEVLYNAKEGDLIYIFFSGHGRSHPTRLQDIYFLAYDSNLKKDRSGIPYSLLIRMINDTKASHVIAFIDACNSGVIPTGKGPPRFDLDHLGKQFSLIPENRVVFSSASGSQPSWEDEKLEHGVFSYYLMEGLLGKAKDKNYSDYIDLGELFDFVSSEVYRHTSGNKKMRPQRPRLWEKNGLPAENFPVSIRLK